MPKKKGLTIYDFVRFDISFYFDHVLLIPAASIEYNFTWILNHFLHSFIHEMQNNRENQIV